MLLNKKIAALIIFFCAISVTNSQLSCQARNEAAAKAEDPTRECRKECTTDADCTGAKTCNCDDLCGASCFNPDAECPDLTGTLVNGAVSMPNGRKYGEKAKHTCNTGYFRKGEEKRICRSNREWSHNATTCIRGCEFPPTRGNGYPDVDPDRILFLPGDTVTYMCNTGYTQSGDMDVTCQSDYTWSPIGFVCTIKNCGAPEDIANGGYEGTNFNFGGSVRYYCNTGYDLQGQEIQRCMSEAEWDPGRPYATCKIRTCPAPDAFSNGEVDDRTAPDLQFGQSITYKCNTGYRLEGSATGTCNENGTWGDVPTCLVDLACDFENSVETLCGYTRIDGTFVRTYLDSAGISGNPGYVLAGYGTIRSLPMPLADNEEVCLSVDMKAVSDGELLVHAYNGATSIPIHAFPASTGWTTHKFKLKKVAAADKEAQLELRASGNVELDDIKELDNSDCADIGKSCEKPTLEDGSMTPDRVLYATNVEVTYGCSDGHTLQGVPAESPTGTCNKDGTWSATPTCKSVPTTTTTQAATTTTTTTKAGQTANTELTITTNMTPTTAAMTPTTTSTPGASVRLEISETASATSAIETPTTTSATTATTTTTTANNVDVEDRAESPDSNTPASSTTSPATTTVSKGGGQIPTPGPLENWVIGIIVVVVLLAVTGGAVGSYFLYKSMTKNKAKVTNGYTSATPENGAVATNDITPYATTGAKESPYAVAGPVETPTTTV